MNSKITNDIHTFTYKYLNLDALKSVIIDTEVTINVKNQNVRINQDVSNNIAPVCIERGDRRYIVTHSSRKYKSNHSYFKQLCDSFKETFYSNLLTFFMKRDISAFNPRVFPLTETKKQILEASKSTYEHTHTKHSMV